MVYDVLLGEIRLFAENYAPDGWVSCDGQLLPIDQNQSLFSLLSNRFGGDARVNFAIPKLNEYYIESGANFGPGNRLKYYIAAQGIYPSIT